MELIPFGEDGWLLVADDPIAVVAALDRRGLDDVVPGERHVLMRGPWARVQAALDTLSSAPLRPAPSRPVLLNAKWDGPDLQHVAQRVG